MIFDVGLLAALVVSMCGLDAVTGRPLMEVGPTMRVVQVALLRVYAV